MRLEEKYVNVLKASTRSIGFKTDLAGTAKYSMVTFIR